MNRQKRNFRKKANFGDRCEELRQIDANETK